MVVQMIQERIIKNKILKLVEKYYNVKWGNIDKLFIPGQCKINYSGRIFDDNELVNAIDSILEFWLSYGRYSKQFEKDFSDFLGVKYSLLVNSGSSANLTAISALMSDDLEDRRLKRGDSIITTALCFPTTITPIIQNGLMPIFVDVNINTLNIDISNLYKALNKNTRAIFVANTLGNPVNLDALKYFCDENELYLILDCCDSLGSIYKDKHLDNYCHISTHSFFPAHTITAGYAGAVCTNDKQLKNIMHSLIEWGRKYHCSDCNWGCKTRFDRKEKLLPENYDCRYIFSERGFNLRPTDIQASILCAQLKKLPDFIGKRKKNWNKLYEGLKNLSSYFIFQQAEKKSDVSWFGFAVTLKDNVSFKRIDLIKFLEDRKIETRLLFAGDILGQPCMKDLKENVDYEVIGNLKNTNKIMNNTFFLGVYPGITNMQIDYICDSIKKFIKRRS